MQLLNSDFMVRFAKRLEVGLINLGEEHLPFLIEMLNHQGIIYKEISNRTGNSVKFPCVIQIGRSKSDQKKALNYCENPKNIIIADELIPFNFVLSGFTGVLDKPYLENKLLTPQISELEVKLVNEIRKCYYRLGLPLIRKWFWPNNAKACCIITHDIDTMNNSPPKGFNIDFIKYLMIKLLNKKAYKTNIDKILYEEKKRNLKASFYFFPDYGNYQSDFIENLELLDNGFEIGLHAPLHTYNDPQSLNKFKNVISELSKREIVGIRQHGLEFSPVHSWKYYDEVGLDYDVTFAYNNKFGFRAGLCYPYHPFDALSKEKFKVLEIPTSFMDYTGLLQKMNYDNFIDIFKRLIYNVEKYNGCFVLIFHSEFINEKLYPEITKLFTKTLDYIKENKYWVPTAQECSNWWQTRENAKIDIEFNDGLISGKTSTPLPICIEVNGKNKKFKNIENSFKVRLK
jgi:hypothetical protein